MLNNTRAALDLRGAALAAGSGSARRWLGVLASVFLAVALSACGSNVKLNNASPVAMVPAKDRNCGDMSDLPMAALMPPSAPSRAVSGVEVASINVAQPTDMLQIVYFDFDSSVVRDEFNAVLEAHARYLGANSSRLVALEGHTDERGSREYNVALGQRRSEAVRRVLSVLGVKESQMEAVSFGEEKPAVRGFDEAAYAKNRRVELTYR